MNDLPVGRSVDETLRLVQAFQYTDQHGEVGHHFWLIFMSTINVRVIETIFFSLMIGMSGWMETRRRNYNS